MLANDLERLLYGRPRDTGVAGSKIAVPVDRERNLALLDIREPVRRIEDVILSRETQAAVEEVLQEHHHRERLGGYGMRPADRLLFYGPPGCGKTLTAEVIASELGLPLAVVRVDAVVSSYLGETAANLRKVFDFAAAHAAGVLFDEFDALAKERSAESEHGELRRVVNAVLQMMDAYVGCSVLSPGDRDRQPGRPLGRSPLRDPALGAPSRPSSPPSLRAAGRRGRSCCSR